ncbi:MAG: hypothetical protein ACE5FI_02380 [Anaerolineales bacterium]
MPQTLDNNDDSYRIYVLYCWRDDTDVSRDSNWRISVERVGGDEGRRGFASLKDTFTYLNLDLVGRPVKLPWPPAANQPRPPAGKHHETRDTT